MSQFLKTYRQGNGHLYSEYHQQGFNAIQRQANSGDLLEHAAQSAVLLDDHPQLTIGEQGAAVAHQFLHFIRMLSSFASPLFHPNACVCPPPCGSHVVVRKTRLFISKQLQSSPKKIAESTKDSAASASLFHLLRLRLETVFLQSLELSTLLVFEDIRKL